MKNKVLGLHTQINIFKSMIDNMHCTDSSGKLIDIEQSIEKVIEQLLNTKDKLNAVYVIGNGGSASVASHATTDFINVCKLRAFTLHDAPLMTCMTNEFGYEQAYSRILNTILCQRDILVAISSSGK